MRAFSCRYLVARFPLIHERAEEGVIDRFRSLPASRPAYLMGHYLAELAGMLLSIAVLLLGMSGGL